jgi:hypothetical protein
MLEAAWLGGARRAVRCHGAVSNCDETPEDFDAAEREQCTTPNQLTFGELWGLLGMHAAVAPSAVLTVTAAARLKLKLKMSAMLSNDRFSAGVIIANQEVSCSRDFQFRFALREAFDRGPIKTTNTYERVRMTAPFGSTILDITSMHYYQVPQLTLSRATGQKSQAGPRVARG